jgi:hypothetical protein
MPVGSDPNNESLVLSRCSVCLSVFKAETFFVSEGTGFKGFVVPTCLPPKEVLAAKVLEGDYAHDICPKCFFK